MLFDREIQILNILWNADTELTSTDIVEAGERLSQSTVQAVLRKLLAQEIVEVASITHSGNVLSRAYRPTAKSRELALLQIEDYVNSMAHLIGDEKAAQITNLIRS